MSYILDALKKSEQERQQSQLPDVVVQQPLWHLHSGRSRRPNIWLVVLVVCNIAFIGWFLFNQFLNTDGSVVKSDDLRGNIQPQYAPLTNASHQKASVESDAHNSSIVSRGDVLEAQGPVNAPVESSSVRVNEAPVSPDTDKGTPKVSSQNVPDAAVPAFEAEVGFSESHVHESVNDIPTINQLRTSEQQRIPRIMFNSHVYSPDPSASRVLINNVYLKNGDRLGSLEVLHIESDSVVLRVDDIRFRLGALNDWQGGQ